MTDGNPPPSKIIPNTFQTPNILTDEVMSLLTGNEVKCCLLIIRKTFGWHKRSDRISKSQIIEATGLGETAVDSSMDALVKFGLVLRVAENNPAQNIGVEWALQLDSNLIQWTDLKMRTNNVRSKQSKSAEKARSKRSIGGVDGQPQVDGQDGGGVDGQATQKPLSKANTTTTGETVTQNIFKVYQENIGMLTPMISDTLKDAEDEYGPQWVVEAIALAVKNNKRNWKYCEAILKRWKADGKDSGERPARKNEPKTGKSQSSKVDLIARVLGVENDGDE